MVNAKLVCAALVAIVYCLSSLVVTVGADGERRAAYRDYISYTRDTKCDRKELVGCCPAARALRFQRGIVGDLVGCITGLVTNILSFKLRLPGPCCKLPLLGIICSFLPPDGPGGGGGGDGRISTSSPIPLPPIDIPENPF